MTLSREATRPAHPRSRGENNGKNALLEMREGSSPLTRGKLRFRRLLFALLGLIPAHAGKTRGCWTRSRGARAHPRSRGENVREMRFLTPDEGSSPLTRGKLPERLAPPCIVRLIPAHAGKTTAAPALTFPIRAHPRSRGENRVQVDESGEPLGSSPLTRGKHL